MKGLIKIACLVAVAAVLTGCGCCGDSWGSGNSCNPCASPCKPCCPPPHIWDNNNCCDQGSCGGY